MPQLFTMVVAYTGIFRCQVHRSRPNDIIHIHTRTHKQTHHRSINSQKATLHRIPDLLAHIKRKAYAIQSPITLFSMPFYTPRPPLNVTTDPRGSALQYLQTHPFTIREMCAYLYRREKNVQHENKTF